MFLTDYSTGKNITVGHQTKSGHKYHATDHSVSQSDKMSGRKCAAAWLAKYPLFLNASFSTDTVEERRAKASSRHFNVREIVAELQLQTPDVDVAEA